MNQTTTGCATCSYYFNGQCTRADRCYGNSRSYICSTEVIPKVIPKDVVEGIIDTVTGLTTTCWICGKTMSMNVCGDFNRICDECKEAMAWVKEKMMEQ